MKTILLYEKYFFLLLVAVHLVPVAFIEFFITHDGPSHVYNSRLVIRLLKGDALADAYFQFNPDPVPNWLGHAILAFFNLFAAGNVSERLLLGIYVISFPLSFRGLLLVLNNNSRWASYLVFPFIYSLLFYLGFYNFCIGIPLLFFSLSYFIRNIDDLKGKKNIVILLLSLLMYFCHIFIVALFALASSLYLCSIYFFSVPEKKGNPLRQFLRSAGPLAVAMLPCLLLLIFFFGSTEATGGFQPLELHEQLRFLFILRPLITLSFDVEQYFSMAASVAFWLLLLYVISVKIVTRQFSAAETWLALAFLLLTAYFIVPDQLASGQFVNMRMLLFYFLFSLVWIGINPVPHWMKIFSISVFLSVSLWFLRYHFRESKKLSDETEEFVSCLGAVKEGSVVLPLNYTSNWILMNATAYAGAMKKIISLDNYEAETVHFPLQWKPGMNLYDGKNTTAIFIPYSRIGEYEIQTGRKIDYILRWNYDSLRAEANAKSTDEAVRKKYIRIFTSASGRAEVFKREK